MTLSECKALVRRAKTLMRDAGASLRSGRVDGVDALFQVGRQRLESDIQLPRADYEAMYWGMRHLPKVWIPAGWDAEGQAVGPWTLKRLGAGALFCRNDGTENFMFKGVAVRPT